MNSPPNSESRREEGLKVPRVDRGSAFVAEIKKKREVEIQTIGGFVAPTVSALAEHTYARRDPARILTHRIDIE